MKVPHNKSLCINFIARILIVPAVTMVLILLSCHGQEMKVDENPLESSAHSTDIHQNILVHNVYFNLKDGLTEEHFDTFKTELLELKNIPEVKRFYLGKPVDTGDERANLDCDYVLEMHFSDKNDLMLYQKNEIHLTSKKATGHLLAGAPRVYDYWIE